MAQPPTAGPPELPPSWPPLEAPPRRQKDTARIAPLGARPSRVLPGWFWGALGCFSVLVVGLSLLFASASPGLPFPAAAAPTAATTMGGAPSLGGAAPAMQVEPIVAPLPSRASADPVPAGKPKLLHVLKFARSPGSVGVRRFPAAPATDGDKPADSASDDSAVEEELLRPHKASAAVEEELLRPRKPATSAPGSEGGRSAKGDDEPVPQRSDDN